MDFHQRVELQFGGTGGEFRHFHVGQRRRDQQDAIGAGQTRLGDLPGVDHEILAQQRKVSGAARKSSRLPWKYLPSVRTERQEAPASA